MSVFKDERVDKIVTWVVGLLVSGVMAIAAFTYSDLRTTMNSLGQAVNGLTTQVALAEEREKEVARLGKRVSTLEERQDEIRLWKAQIDK